LIFGLNRSCHDVRIAGEPPTALAMAKGLASTGGGPAGTSAAFGGGLRLEVVALPEASAPVSVVPVRAPVPALSQAESEPITRSCSSGLSSLSDSSGRTKQPNKPDKRDYVGGKNLTTMVRSMPGGGGRTSATFARASSAD